MDLVEQGKELAQQGQYGEALEVFKKALKEQPDDPDVLFFVGTCYSSLGDFPAAKYYYQEALEIDPNHSRTMAVWRGIEDVEARAPDDSGSSRRKKEKHGEAPPHKESPPQPTGYTDPEAAGETRWSRAFPDTMLEPKKKTRLGVWLWILVVIVVAATVYFFVGPKLFE